MAAVLDPSARPGRACWRLVVLGGAFIAAPLVFGLGAGRGNAGGIGIAVAALTAFGWSAWRLSGELWPHLGRRRSLAVLGLGFVLALAVLVPGFFYSYIVTITAGLCGDEGRAWLAILPAAAYAIVLSWGLRSPRRLPWAWPLAVLSAVAANVLMAYIDPGAHGFCETSTPNEVSILAGAEGGGGTRYSAALTMSLSPPRRNVA